jgi:hypothetical protein
LGSSAACWLGCTDAGQRATARRASAREIEASRKRTPTQSKSLSASWAKLMWTTRGDAPMLAFIEQVLVARDHVVEHERHRGWNRLVAGLQRSLAGILGRRGSKEDYEV